MFINVLIVFVAILLLFVLLKSPLSKNKIWNATITPLASIIGSGFLILGPLLQQRFGIFALLGMLVLCLISYGIGAGIRYNIQFLEPLLKQNKTSKAFLFLEKIAGYALFFAYVISVCYYLNLFGAFFLKAFDPQWSVYGKWVTTVALLLIGVFGLVFGLSLLEKAEKYSVSIKLAIITGLILGLVFFNVEAGLKGHLHWGAPHLELSGEQVFVLLGLIITVQGFETSRYLGAEYNAAVRIKSMKYAQWISFVIYLLYIGLSMANYMPISEGSNMETAIIEQSGNVATVLPVLLIVAALASQFSAAVADTNGGGGLFSELSKYKLSAKIGFLIIASAGILITWTMEVFQIISLASKAFAIYYALQMFSASLLAWKYQKYLKFSLFLLITLICLCVVVFGIPAE